MEQLTLTTVGYAIKRCSIDRHATRVEFPYRVAQKQATITTQSEHGNTLYCTVDRF